MKTVYLCALSAFVCSCFLLAQIDDLPSPTPVPFTPEPGRFQWRIGFNLGNATILEVPELNPDNDFSSAVAEAERLIPHPFLAYGLAFLPFSKIKTRSQELVNPRQWTVLDLQNKETRKSFQGLAVFMGSRMTSSEGGYHLVSVPVFPRDPFLGVRKEPAPEDLIFGFAGAKSRIQLRTKVSETRWEKLLPVEDPATLPAGYELAKQLLSDDSSDNTQRFLYGTSIEALVRNRLTKLWLLNYSHPDTTMGSHPWGIFAEDSGALQPLFIRKPISSETPYVAYFKAALDLNQDGSDELVIEASYRLGTAYKVISGGGKYQEVFTSYYRGPAS